jgi:hypothetical protein
LGRPKASVLAGTHGSAVLRVVGLPNADRAVVEDAKVRDYLLSPTHPVGRFKSVFFVALGFSADRWSLLRDALLELARSGDATPRQARSEPSSRSVLNSLDLLVARQTS